MSGDISGEGARISGIQRPEFPEPALVFASLRSGTGVYVFVPSKSVVRSGCEEVSRFAKRVLPG